MIRHLETTAPFFFKIQQVQNLQIYSVETTTTEEKPTPPAADGLDILPSIHRPRDPVERSPQVATGLLP
jgi:hypothetical protein